MLVDIIYLGECVLQPAERVVKATILEANILHVELFDMAWWLGKFYLWVLLLHLERCLWYGIYIY
jgi:hypothetical protein